MRQSFFNKKELPRKSRDKSAEERFENFKITGLKYNLILIEDDLQTKKIASNKIKVLWKCVLCRREPFLESLTNLNARFENGGNICKCNPRTILSTYDKIYVEDFVAELDPMNSCRLLSEYTGIRDKLIWWCDEHGEFERSFDQIKFNNILCYPCIGLEIPNCKPLTLDQLQQDAINVGCKLIVPNPLPYINNRLRFDLECLTCGTIKEKASVTSFRYHKDGCQTCAKPLIYAARCTITIEDVLKYCEERKLECLEKSYTTEPMKFRCKVCEYSIFVRFKNMKSANGGKGSGCRACAGCVKLTIEEAQEAAENNNGKCLSEKYVDINAPMWWKCHNPNHEKFEKPLLRVRHCGAWCNDCYDEERRGQSTRLTLEDYHFLAEERGFKCLETERPANVLIKVKWQCKKLHEWPAKYNNIKYGHRTGCPTCNDEDNLSKMERATIEFAEEYGFKFETQVKFDGKNFDYPVLKDKSLLSFDAGIFDMKDFGLDEDCEFRMMMVETDGEQHYKACEYFGGEETFRKQVHHDYLKTQYCLDNGIHLIRIKYNQDVKKMLDQLICRVIEYAKVGKLFVMGINYQ